MPDTVWFIFAIIMAISAVALGAWALFWDRARGRLRCPKCQYRMEGIPASTVLRQGNHVTGHICPECGHVSATTQDLRRTHRRWRLALLAPLILFAAHMTSHVPEIKNRTWRAAVPTPLLVSLWPVDFLLDDPIGSDELAARTNRTWPRSIERVWVERMTVHQLALLQTRRDPRRPLLQYRIYDLRDLWKFLHIDESASGHTISGCAFAGSDPYQPVSRSDRVELQKVDWIAENTQSIRDMLSLLIDSEDWDINGGDGGTIFQWGSHIVAIEDADTLHKLDRIFEQFRRVVKNGAGATETCDYVSPHVAMFNEDDLRIEDQNACYGAQYKRQELAGIERGHFICTTIAIIAFDNPDEFQTYQTALAAARKEAKLELK